MSAVSSLAMPAVARPVAFAAGAANASLSGERAG